MNMTAEHVLDSAELAASRGDLVTFCHACYRKDYTTGTDGNLSVRLPDGGMLITRSGLHKGFATADDIVRVGPDGPLIELVEPIDRSQRPDRPEQQVSSEYAMHALVYELRPDVQAVIHAHPPECIACSIAGVDLSQVLTPEAPFYLDDIPMAAYALPTTHELPESIRHLITSRSAILLERHGTLTVGTTLLQAFCRLETMVSVARTYALARLLGKAEPLPASEVARIFARKRELRGEPPASASH